MTETRTTIKEAILNLLRIHIEGLHFNEIYRKLPIPTGKPTLSIVVSEMVANGELEKIPEPSKGHIQPQLYKLAKLNPLDKHMVETERQLASLRPSRDYLKKLSKVDRRIAVYNYLARVDHLVNLAVLFYAFERSRYFEFSPKNFESIIVKTARKAQEAIELMDEFGQEENTQLFNMLASVRMEPPFILSTKIDDTAPEATKQSYEERVIIENALEKCWDKLGKEMESTVRKALKDARKNSKKKKG